MFRGRHDHTIDAKGRLSIPRVFRGELAGEDGPPMLVNMQDHLALYPAQTWGAVEQSLAKKSSLDPAAQDLRLFFGQGSVSCDIDSQGRILVPGFLRDHASLDNKVIVAGAYEYVAIWNPSRFADKFAKTVENLHDLQREVNTLAGS